MSGYRTHTCGEPRLADAGKDVRLSGWVHRLRDHGGLKFIDLRDHYGITQIVVDPDSPAFATAETLHAEWVIQVAGRCRPRPEGTENPDLPTGQIEIFAAEIAVLSEAAELPLPVFGDQEYPEDIRLRYRFLDLRRERLHRNIIRRGAIIDSLRRRMRAQGFFEFQTPILTASSPEGARDFLVPSRLHPGKFYALPQAPQQFKQLIMISGFDRYFQIAPCFRDEDARADRSPGEFYQLDIEMSFVNQEDVFDAVEPVLRGVFEEFAEGRPVTAQFPRIPYRQAIRKYGSDKPDLRNPIEMADVTEHFAGSGFKVFAAMIAEDRKVEVWAIPAPKGGSRAFCDRMNGWAQSQGQPGLGYIFWREGEEGGAGPIASNIGAERSDAIRAPARARGRGRGVLRRRAAGEVLQICRRGAQPGRRASSISSTEDGSRSAGSSISRCMSGTRRRRRSTSRTIRSRCRRAGSTPLERARTLLDILAYPVRHRLQRHRAVFRRHPQPPARYHAEGLRDRRLSAKRC